MSHMIISPMKPIHSRAWWCESDVTLC